MGLLGTELGDENQDVMQQSVRDFLEAGAIAEKNQDTMQQQFGNLTEDEEENAEEDQGPIPRHSMEMMLLAHRKHAERMKLHKSYMPDIDGGWHMGNFLANGDKPPLAISSIYAEQTLLKQIGFSFDGRTVERSFTPLEINSWDEIDSDMNYDIEIYSVSFALEALVMVQDYSKIQSFLGLAPCLYWQIECKSHYGLGRRFLSPNDELCGVEHMKGKKRNEIGEEARSYHIWFLLPVSHLRDKSNPETQKFFKDLGMRDIHLPMIQLSFEERLQCFYMKVNIKSRSVRIFTNSGGEEIENFNAVSQRAAQQGSQYDPFIFVCSSISALLHHWVGQRYYYLGKIRETEIKVLALGESFDQLRQPETRENHEIERENLQKARRLMLELHELRSYQLREKLNFGYLSSIINETLNEHHHDIHELLDISPTAYLQVEKNLCTLASWVQAMKHKLESAQKTTDSCLSTLSLLLTMRNNYSVEENTKFLATMAEHSSKENYQVKDIAEATQKDSEAVKTIAMMTMFYLPASFVAVR
ncbi:hypothetical protein BDW59DRAFT_158335 [Aspergillus cavernicola]|uniref:Uncharacterized protein n=1 Tax=Aspergillus cavernicola TaxID=176166 RepID=A0ABR4ISZ4_9EURO